VAAYGIVAAHASPKVARRIAALILLFLLYIGFPGFPVFQATLLALVIVLLLMRVDARRVDGAGRWPGAALVFAAGAVNGLMVYFRHDLAAYALAAVVLSIAYQAWRVGAARLFVQDVLAYGVGVAVTFVPLAVYLLLVAGLDATRFALIESPGEIYPTYRSMPFPAVEFGSSLLAPRKLVALLVYFPFVVVSLAVLARIVDAASVRGSGTARAAPVGEAVLAPRIGVLLALMAALFCLKGYVRPQVAHFAPAIVLSLVLAGCMMARRSWVSSRVLPIVLVLFFAVPAVRFVTVCVRNVPDVIAACVHPAHPRLVCVPADAGTVAAVTFIDRELSQFDDLYVGPGRHDRIFGGNVAAYFLSAKRPVTKWHEPHPGLQTRPDIQREIIAELEGSKSLVVMLDGRRDHKVGARAAGLPPGSGELDAYLREEFTVARQLDGITILTRAGNGAQD